MQPDCKLGHLLHWVSFLCSVDLHCRAVFSFALSALLPLGRSPIVQGSAVLTLVCIVCSNQNPVVLLKRILANFNSVSRITVGDAWKPSSPKATSFHLEI